MSTMPTWTVPNDSDAIREASRLSISEILDRQIDLEAVIAETEPESVESKRAKVLLRATFVALQQRYACK